jgi:hypothetical protein
MTIPSQFTVALLACVACGPPVAPLPDAEFDADAAEPVDAVSIDSAIDAAVDAPDAAPPPDGPTHVSGSFALGVSTAHESNCSPGGARIDTMTLALVDSSGSCVSTTVQIEEIGEFSLLCDQVNTVPCFEPANRVISGPLAPGGYHLQVDGLRGSSLCWRGDASIGVSEGTPDEHTLVLLPSPDTCDGEPRSASGLVGADPQAALLR